MGAVEPTEPIPVYGAWLETETQALVWEDAGEVGSGGYVDQIVEMSEKYAAAEVHAVLESKIVTGKLRLEYQWKDLN